MQLEDLLPCGDKKPSTWLFEFLKEEVLPDAGGILADDDLEEQRARNERLAAYLSSMTVSLYAFRTFLDARRAKWIRDNPKPEKGVTEWREAFDLEVSAYRNLTEMLADLIEVIKTKVSVTQSNLKSHSREG